jgi:hypothetical protein
MMLPRFFGLSLLHLIDNSGLGCFVPNPLFNVTMVYYSDCTKTALLTLRPHCPDNFGLGLTELALLDELDQLSNHRCTLYRRRPTWDWVHLPRVGMRRSGADFEPFLESDNPLLAFLFASHADLLAFV